MIETLTFSQNADVVNLTYSDVPCPHAGCGRAQNRSGAPL